MERYFIVTEKSSLHKEWFDYLENRKAVNDLVKQFVENNGIESQEYYVDSESIYIVPTEKDEEAFGNKLGAAVNEGLRKFKASSKVGKAWVQALKDANLNVMHKPRVIWYFKSLGGRFRSRIFDQNGILYCSLEPCADETPKGFEEIKASEFFKIIEESEQVSA